MFDFLSVVPDDLFVLTCGLFIAHGLPACACMHAFAYIRVFACISQYLPAVPRIGGGGTANFPPPLLLTKTPAVRPSTYST